MQNINGYHSENISWQIQKMKANLTKRKRAIELLREYNKQDGQRLVKLISNK
jgi:hypothetical protein